jgi:hypothetical protein
MKAVYEAPYAIPELGVERGDVILVEPAHPRSPLLVVRRFDRNRLPLILDHLDRLSPVSFDGAAPLPVSQVRSLLRGHALRRRPSHLRAV